MTTEEIVAAIQNGESERISELWERVSKFVRYRAYKYSRLSMRPGVADLDDLCQSAYFSLIRAVKTFQPISDPSADCGFIAWLSIYLRAEFAEVAYNRTAAQRNDSMRRAESLDAPVYVGGEEVGSTRGDLLEEVENCIETAEKRLYIEQLRAALEKALNSIPPEQADVIREHYFNGRPFSEIGPRAKTQATLAIRNLRRPNICARLRRFLAETPLHDHTEIRAASQKKELPTRETMEKILKGDDNW